MGPTFWVILILVLAGIALCVRSFGKKTVKESPEIRERRVEGRVIPPAEKPDDGRS